LTWYTFHKIVINAAVGGTTMVVDVEQATRIIEALTSTNYQPQHGRKIVQKKGCLSLILQMQA